MSNYDDLLHYERSAAYNREWAERMRQRRSEARAKGESTRFYDEEISRAERQASKDAETAIKMRGWMGAGAPSQADLTSVAEQARREVDEMDRRAQ
ncbi:hypothetical protein [Streptomyces griseosporeus]|jgi:hypothetical protein|uniref:hypothetical protein n=1 Tax=Streptomyces griseosporeus TaxID=1910 RepID=UPI0036ABE9FE